MGRGAPTPVLKLELSAHCQVCWRPEREAETTPSAEEQHSGPLRQPAVPRRPQRAGWPPLGCTEPWQFQCPEDLDLGSHRPRPLLGPDWHPHGGRLWKRSVQSEAPEMTFLGLHNWRPRG